MCMTCRWEYVKGLSQQKDADNGGMLLACGRAYLFYTCIWHVQLVKWESEVHVPVVVNSAGRYIGFYPHRLRLIWNWVGRICCARRTKIILGDVKLLSTCFSIFNCDSHDLLQFAWHNWSGNRLWLAKWPDLPSWITQVPSFSKKPILYNSNQELNVSDYMVETNVTVKHLSSLLACRSYIQFR